MVSLGHREINHLFQNDKTWVSNQVYLQVTGTNDNNNLSKLFQLHLRATWVFNIFPKFYKGNYSYDEIIFRNKLGETNILA